MFLRVVPVGEVSESILDSVKDELEGLDVKCRVMGKVDIPKEAYNQWRKQYNAEVAIEFLSTMSEVKFIDKSIPTLLITGFDLYYAGLNFIFGLEDPTRSCAIVSMARLKPEFYDERPSYGLLEERTVKEVVHELGHYIGLDHCRHVFCVMCFSPSVYDVDKKKKDFCEDCRMTMMEKGVSLG